MAEFITSDHFQSLIKPSFPLLDHVFDDHQSMEEITHFSLINPNTTTTTTTTTTRTITTNNNNNNNNFMDNSTLLNLPSFVPFSSDNFFPNPAPDQLIMISPNLAQNFQGNNLSPNSSVSQKPSVHMVGDNDNINNNDYYYSHESKKRKAVLNLDASESSSGMSSPLVSENGNKTKNGSGKGKRVKNINEKDEEKPKDVVHVRARRGQATDSHSLAERVRRGKINERLKCLQDIVPGCYKTMGMAVMLDEIINYVQSLQNQVEFLSMKLTAASTFYDFNSETDAVEKLQRAKANEGKEMERLIREGYGGFACFNSTWPL